MKNLIKIDPNGKCVETKIERDQASKYAEVRSEMTTQSKKNSELGGKETFTKYTHATQKEKKTEETGNDAPKTKRGAAVVVVAELHYISMSAWVVRNTFIVVRTNVLYRCVPPE